jgi:hypothetical protein
VDKHVATCSLEKKLSGPKCCLIVHWKQNVWYKVDYKLDLYWKIFTLTKKENKLQWFDKMFVWMVAWTNHDEYICWGWHKPLFGKDVRLHITFNIMSKFGRQHRPFRGCLIGNKSFLQRYFCTIYICFPLLQKISPNVINNHIFITCVWASSIFFVKKIMRKGR